MPLTNDFFQPKNCDLAIWEIRESVEELHDGLSLSVAQTQELTTRKTRIGQQGFLAVRHALQQLGIALEELEITPEGAPHLPNNYCSLSHTPHYAVAATASTPLGIDLEKERQKIHHIAPKFAHPNERDAIDKAHEIAQLTRLWTAKEAVYKAIKQNGISFAHQIRISPFSLQAKRGEAQVFLSDKTLKLGLQFSTFNQHHLTIAHLIQEL